MAMSSLYWRPPGPWGEVGLQTTKKGAVIFGGHPKEFQEWKFRTESLYEATETSKKGEVGNAVLEGLYGNAYLVAQDQGVASLSLVDGVPKLAQAIEDSLFPIIGIEAKELYLSLIHI